MAVIGTGFVGPHHIDAIRRIGLADVVAIAGTDPARTADRAAALGIDDWTTDTAVLLADPAIDVVHICTPNRTHVALATAVLQAGKHVVVEKPLALDLAEARSLVALARRVDRHAAVTLTYRGYPMVRRARALVADGVLGDLRLVHGVYLQDWLAGPSDHNWRVDAAIGGASGAVADIGSHWFDTAEFIAGRRIQGVFADLATFVPRRRRPLAHASAFGGAAGPVEDVEVSTEDAATILVRFEGGARGACVISQVSPGRKNELTVELAGARRTISWRQEDPELLWVRGRKRSSVLTRGPDEGTAGPGIPSLPAGHPEGWSDALRDLLRPFYAAVASGRSIPEPGTAAYPTLEHGARGVAFIEAVLGSARKGAWASIPGSS
ncbi:MAG: Gfo/Idh/MocA family oxidoreductase [Chloroflexi bacterium]|nr:Gfo/Idh/MocA family oxidoreductase [Chloroflexota bacterium]